MGRSCRQDSCSCLCNKEVGEVFDSYPPALPLRLCGGERCRGVNHLKQWKDGHYYLQVTKITLRPTRSNKDGFCKGAVIRFTHRWSWGSWFSGRTCFSSSSLETKEKQRINTVISFYFKIRQYYMATSEAEKN